MRQLHTCALLALGLALGREASSAFPSVTLSNGVQLPLVSLGTGESPNETRTDMETALSVGFVAIDTALTYFDQSGVAKAIADEAAKYPRSELFITTKVPGCGKGVDCYKSTMLDAAANLAELKLDYVDLLLVHWTPLTGCALPADCKVIQQQWAAMEQVYREKKARAIGVSNYCERCFKCLLRNSTVTPMVNQIELHVGMAGHVEPLVSFCKSAGVVPMAYSPLGPTFNTTAKDVLIEGNLTNSIGKAHGKSGAQVALKWLVQQGIPIATRASSARYLAQDIELFDWNLTSTELASLGAATEPKGGGRGDGPCLFCEA